MSENSLTSEQIFSKLDSADFKNQLFELYFLFKIPISDMTKAYADGFFQKIYWRIKKKIKRVDGVKRLLPNKERQLICMDVPGATLNIDIYSFRASKEMVQISPSLEFEKEYIDNTLVGWDIAIVKSAKDYRDENGQGNWIYDLREIGDKIQESIGYHLECWLEDYFKLELSRCFLQDRFDAEQFGSFAHQIGTV